MNFNTNIRVRDFFTILQLIQKNLCTYAEEGGLRAVYTNHKQVSQRMFSESTVQQVYAAISPQSYTFPRILVVSFALPSIYSCGGLNEGGCASASTITSETLDSDFSFE